MQELAGPMTGGLTANGAGSRRGGMELDAGKPAYFHSSRGGDSNGPAVKDYYNPRRGTFAKKRKFEQTAARLFAELGAAGVGLRQVSLGSGFVHNDIRHYYHSRSDILAELLTHHLVALAETVAAADERFRTQPAPMRFEAMVLAYLDLVAAQAHEHRTLLFSANLLGDAARRPVLLRHEAVLEAVLAALQEVVPGLAGRPEAGAALVLMLRDLLSPAREWGSVEEPEDRRARARRVSGMMLAAARAEVAGSWRELGPAEGGPLLPPVIRVESREARVRLRALLDAVAAGAEVVVSRRGVPAARLVGMRAGGVDVHLVSPGASDVDPALTDDSCVAAGADVHPAAAGPAEVHPALTVCSSGDAAGLDLADVHRLAETAPDVDPAVTGSSPVGVARDGVADGDPVAAEDGWADVGWVTEPGLPAALWGGGAKDGGVDDDGAEDDWGDDGTEDDWDDDSAGDDGEEDDWEDDDEAEGDWGERGTEPPGGR